jgi:hypothetical protein
MKKLEKVKLVLIEKQFYSIYVVKTFRMLLFSWVLVPVY